jgi:transcriptional regulator with XRE-family HTH domain
MPERLAEELRRVRALRGVSLRQVEEATKISNAYLSQLETGKAERPSPHVLHTLATYYEVPYEFLMEAAGYLRPSAKERRGLKSLARLEAAAMSARLDPKEEAQVVEFIEFLRAQRRRRGR